MSELAVSKTPANMRPRVLFFLRIINYDPRVYTRERISPKWRNWIHLTNALIKGAFIFLTLWRLNTFLILWWVRSATSRHWRRALKTRKVSEYLLSSKRIVRTKNVLSLERAHTQQTHTHTHTRFNGRNMAA